MLTVLSVAFVLLLAVNVCLYLIKIHSCGLCSERASAPVWSGRASSLFLSRHELVQLEFSFFLPCEEIPPLDPIKFINRVEHFYVVMYALCVAFLLTCLVCMTLLSMHMNSSWPIGDFSRVGALDDKVHLKISNKFKANMRPNTLLLLLRG